MPDIMTETLAEVETTTCDRCGFETPWDETAEVQGEILCEDCVANETSTCSRCGNRIFDDNNVGNGDTVLCQNCYDNHYTNCDCCGNLLHREETHGFEDDDYDYCYSCYINKSRNRSIHDYYYRPEPIFYGDGKRYFGIELEVDDGGEDSDYADKLLNIGNYSCEHIYCKHDGSLDNGFELVSHPMSLEYHQNTMPWKGVLHKALDLDYRSHQTDTCGLHVHVSRSAFGDSHREQEDAIARVLYFVENHWLEILRFSRRTEYQISRWAARYGRRDNPKDVLDTAKESGVRYSCVNLTNDSTIEFRMFRGTLKLNTLIATLQFVNRICDVALSMSDEEIQNLSWTQFVTDCHEPELIQYLKERRLYVNESVTETEEI